MRRIELIEAPAVLGWTRWRELEETYGLGVAKVVLRAAMDAGVIRRQPIDPVARILFGALVEAALVLASADDAKAARRQVGRIVAGIINSVASSGR